MGPEGSLPRSQESAIFLKPCVTFHNELDFYGEAFSPSPNPQVGVSPLVGCPRLLIQYIHSFSPFLEAAGGHLLYPQPEKEPCRALEVYHQRKISLNKSQHGKG